MTCTCKANERDGQHMAWCPATGERTMPKFGILISKDDNGWWSYCLIINHKITKTATPFTTSQSAFNAARADANIRGHLQPGE